MASKFKLGEEVIQVVPAPIQGIVRERRVDGDDDLFLVSWIDPSDPEVIHERWFKEDEIQVV